MECGFSLLSHTTYITAQYTKTPYQIDILPNYCLVRPQINSTCNCTHVDYKNVKCALLVARQVDKNLLNKNDLPHIVAECVCTSRLQKYTERIRFASLSKIIKWPPYFWGLLYFRVQAPMEKFFDQL